MGTTACMFPNRNDLETSIRPYLTEKGKPRRLPLNQEYCLAVTETPYLGGLLLFLPRSKDHKGDGGKHG